MKTQSSFSQDLISWFKGIWGKFNRWLKRTFNPKHGKRNAVASSSNYSSPLAGVTQFRHPESLTVQELMAKVQWKLPKQAPKTVASVREQINWD